MRKFIVGLFLTFIVHVCGAQTAISALPAATTINPSDFFVVVQGGATKKVAQSVLNSNATFPNGISLPGVGYIGFSNSLTIVETNSGMTFIFTPTGFTANGSGLYSIPATAIAQNSGPLPVGTFTAGNTNKPGHIFVDVVYNGITNRFLTDNGGSLSNINALTFGGLTTNNVNTNNASQLSSGTVPAAQMPAFTGAVSSSAGSTATILANTTTNTFADTNDTRTVTMLNPANQFSGTFTGPATITGGNVVTNGGIFNLSSASYQPTIELQSIKNQNTNVFISYGDPPDGGLTFSWNPNATWVNAFGATITGAWTNLANTLIIAYDASTIGQEFNEGATNMSIVNEDPNYFTSASYNTLQELVYPTFGNWQQFNGTGMFSATNGLLTSGLITNTIYNMAGGTNNFDLWAAIHALPYYQNATNRFGIRSGGVVVVPPGVSFIGAGDFYSGTPFNLTIRGSLGFGGCSVLVITNYIPGSPGLLTLGSAEWGVPGTANTKLSVTLQDLVVCYQGVDYTNAAIDLEYMADCFLENVTVMPANAYFTGDQWALFGNGATNQIGIRVHGLNGQMTYLNSVNVIGNHIGLDLQCDHPVIYHFHGAQEGSEFLSGITNSSWSKSDYHWLSTDILWEGTLNPNVGWSLDVFYPHTFSSYIYFLNASLAAPINVWGGDYSETIGANTCRSVTLFPTNVMPTTFNYMHPYRGQGVPDRNGYFNGTDWVIPVTNTWSAVEHFVTNNTVSALEYNSVGGVPQTVVSPTQLILTNANVFADTGIVYPTNTWSLSATTNGMGNFQNKITVSNTLLVNVFMSNGVPFVSDFTTSGGGVIP